MAKNVVQFQKGLSEAAFRSQYGSEDQCRAAVFRGAGRGASSAPAAVEPTVVLRTRPLAVHDLPPADVVDRRHDLSATKVPLRTWFAAIYHLTQSKDGISSLELGRRLGVTQNTAWKIKHKLMQVMMERDPDKRLTGERIEIDDAYLGGERSGGKRGRGAPARRPLSRPWKPPPRASRCASSCAGSPASAGLDQELGGAPSASRRAGRQRWPHAFRGVADAGCSHQPIRTGSGRKAVRTPAFKWVNTVLGNIKTVSPAPTGPSARNTSRAISPNSNTASIAATISPP